MPGDKRNHYRPQLKIIKIEKEGAINMNMNEKKVLLSRILIGGVLVCVICLVLAFFGIGSPGTWIGGSAGLAIEVLWSIYCRRRCKA